MNAKPVNLGKGAKPAPGASENKEPLLEIKDLQVTFKTQGGEVKAVRKANLTVYPGQTVAIVGESGSGKSTTAAAIIDLLQSNGRVAGGSIKFEGREITGQSRKQIIALRGSSIGLVPQDPMSNLNPMWKVGYQIEEALVANGWKKGAATKQRVVELLAEAGLPDAERRAKQYPHEFSGGMRQRALIAMGLAARPKLLIADEPTSALDVTVQQQILDHLDGLTSELGVAVLLITHDLGLAAERAEHLVVMYRGEVVESGPALEILQDPQHPYTKRLVTSAPSLSSRRLESAAAKGNVEKDETVIKVEGLRKVFKIPNPGLGRAQDFVAVEGASFEMKRGTTTAIVGESGSGKSTIAQMVLGLLEPTAGDVIFEGQHVQKMNRQELFKLRRKMQPVFQNPYGSLDPMYSIQRIIEEPMVLHKIGDSNSRRKKVAELLEHVAMPESTMTRFPNELSGGQRQRIAIARALALDPEVVICDEAVSALDVLVQAQILKLLNDLQQELGLTYLFITHDLAVVRQIADNVVVMEKGKIVEQQTTDALFENPQQEYTRKLLNAIPGGSIELAS
ncbi:ABC transporter ATP-binding protein [Micrococcales bacterium 31B]|nr:ABC transporter ATP-binding protein [Micrococcales bacterium 31B]